MAACAGPGVGGGGARLGVGMESSSSSQKEGRSPRRRPEVAAREAAGRGEVPCVSGRALRGRRGCPGGTRLSSRGAEGKGLRQEGPGLRGG